MREQMDKSGASGRAMRDRRHAEPVRPNQWVHAAGDLGTGQLIMTPQKGQPTESARVEALSRLGLAIDISSVFDGPFCRLSVLAPYQASPRAWFEGVGISYFDSSSEFGTMEFWRAPPGHPNGQQELHFFFSQLNRGWVQNPVPVLLSIPLLGTSYPGPSGHVSVGYLEAGHEQGPVSGQVRVPFAATGTYTFLDLLYPPDQDIEPEFVVKVEDGIDQVYFSTATIASPPPVFNPGSAQGG
jgi:hypothetical protein